MTTERDPRTRTVLSWLREDAHENAERVLLRALDEVDTTPQRRSWWPARRSTQMNRLTQAAITAAAVLVVGLFGYNILPGLIGPGAPGSAPPTASPTSAPPTSGPTPTASGRVVPGAGAIPRGTYSRTWSGGQVTFTLPEGWSANNDGAAIGKLTGGNREVSWGYSFPDTPYEVTRIYTDACRSEGTLTVIGPTLDDLATALRQQAASEATVTDLAIDGHPAKRIEIWFPAGASSADCRYPGLYQVWADEAETGFYALPDGFTGIVFAIDVDGDRLVFEGSVGPAAARSDVAEFESIITSTVIDQ